PNTRQSNWRLYRKQPEPEPEARVAHWKELIAASGLPRNEALALVAHAIGRDAVWLIAHDTDEAPADLSQKADSFVRRRAAGEPMAYITGEREFFGLSLHVTPDVL